MYSFQGKNDLVERLTGKIRYRISFFGKIILQVEYFVIPAVELYGKKINNDFTSYYQWRDARHTDMYKIKPIANTVKT